MSARRASGSVASGRASDRASGQTLLEVMVALAVIAGLLAIALPSLRDAQESARSVACAAYRSRVEAAEGVFQAQRQRHSTSVLELLRTGVLDREHRCPSGGLCAWWTYAPADPRYQTRYGCSLHAQPPEEERDAPIPPLPGPSGPTPGTGTATPR